MLGLKEINSGTFSNNKVIVTSINALLTKCHVKKVLYPLEGRNWEKKIVKLMSKSNIYSIGYLHCALTPRHLSLTRTGFYREDEVPSVIVANSEMSSQIFKKIFPDAIIRNGFFLRGSTRVVNPIQIDPNAFLFALTGNVEESSEILNCLADSEIQENYKVIIRLNPNTSSYPYLSGLAKNLRFNLYNGNEDYLPRICFFRSSSVALEYLRFNVLPVYVCINEIITNNVFELDGKYQFNSLVLLRDKDFKVYLSEKIKSIIGGYSGGILNGAEISNYYLRGYQSSESFSGLLD